ncbi:Hsp70 family protein [Streptomyces sp. YIM S03343]
MAAVDFGTHGSGFAWCPVDAANDKVSDRTVYYFDQWQNQPVVYPKNLTALLLDGTGKVTDWGYSARRALTDAGLGARAGNVRLVQGFKMWLRAGDSPANGHLNGTPAQALPLIASYLRRLREVAVQHITDGGYREEEIRWCLTVPAMWTEYQRNAMRKAAERAGFPGTAERLLLITEPEAAAIHAFARTPSGAPDLPIMVVDCGGGTVDIAAYRPEGDGRLAQLGHTAGGDLGAAYINERFLTGVVRPRFGPELLDRIEREAPDALQEMLDAFESAKRHHDTGRDAPLSITIPGKIYGLLHSSGGLQRLARMQGGQDFHVLVEAKAADDLFEGVVRPLTHLVAERIVDMRKLLGDRKAAIRIVLVGGFAQSPYLRSKLSAFVQQRYGSTVQLLIPPDPARAVLAGAVHYTYRPTVVASRTVELTYGISCLLPFETGVDPERLRYVDDLGKVYCEDRYNIFVQNGDSVAVDQVVTRELIPVQQAQTSVQYNLLSSGEKNPRYSTGEGVRVLGTVDVDLGTAVRLPMEQRKVEISMRFGGTEIEVTSRNVHTGGVLRTTLSFNPDTGA